MNASTLSTVVVVGALVLFVIVVALAFAPHVRAIEGAFRLRY